MPPTLSRTPLYEQSIALQGRMVDFAGWEMAVQYGGIKQEHQAVRTGVGMFDVSHMGKFCLRGAQLLDQLQVLVPSDLSRLQPGAAQYTVLLNPAGKILDDLIFYYQGEVKGEQQFVVIVNAATKTKDKVWLLKHLCPSGDTTDSPYPLPIQQYPAPVTFEDWSEERVLLAVQGPRAIATLQPFVSERLTEIQRFGHRESTVLGYPAFLARTGYTGEDGFEVLIDPTGGRELWQALVEAGVTPCGLGARDTLRLEAAMMLYGQDMDETTTPLEARLGWLVQDDRKENFLGREALIEQRHQGLRRCLVGLEMEGRNIARHGYAVLHEGGVVGTVTSGTWSPTLEKAIALAYVPPHLAQIGQILAVDIRGKACPGRVVQRPFYRKPTLPS